MPRLSAAICCLVLAASGRADWVVGSRQTEASPIAGLTHERIVFENPAKEARAIVDLVIFDVNSAVLRVVDNPDGTQRLDTAMPAQNCVAGVNGGYFDEQFAPLGLRILDGKTLAPLQRARLLSGVLVQTENGVQIFRRSEFSRSAHTRAAVQCGPLLVDLARPVRGLEPTRQARRTFVAVTRDKRAALGCSSDVSLAELGGILAGDVSGVRFHRALNLDGGSSTALWFQRKTGDAFSIGEQKAVRDFVGLSAK